MACLVRVDNIRGIEFSVEHVSISLNEMRRRRHVLSCGKLATLRLFLIDYR